MSPPPDPAPSAPPPAPVRPAVALSAVRSSAAPQRRVGTRVRSGNAMAGTRTALLEAAAVCVARSGVRRTTMGDVATAAGVAKGTLYNHFRTKDAVLDALVAEQCTRLVAACSRIAAGSGLAAALEHAAGVLCALPALRRVSADEPALLAGLARPAPGERWEAVRLGVRGVVLAGGLPADGPRVELVLRWLLSQLMWPVAEPDAAAGAAALVRALAPAGPGHPDAPPEPAREVTGAVPPAPAGGGLGWPGGPGPAR